MSSSVSLSLHEKQSVAFSSEATEILYGGAAGGGKSHLMRVIATAMCYAISGLQVYIFRRKSGDLLKNHMEGPTGFPAMLGEYIDRGYCKINYSKSTIQWWNGSVIHLCHCQHEKNKYDYLGAEIHVLLIDELTTFTKTIYKYLRGRCRVVGIDIPDQFKGKLPLIISGSNPGNIGHNWVKSDFVSGCKPFDIRLMPKVEGGMKRQYIPARLDDNPSLVEADPDYESRLEGLGSPELVRAMKEGDWDIVAGGMFDDVWSMSKHIIQPFEIPSSWFISRAFDWGSSKPFSVGWWAESDGTQVDTAQGKRTFPRGTLFRIGEWYGSTGEANVGLRLTNKEIAEGILLRESAFPWGNRVKPGPADTSIFDEVDGSSFAKDFKDNGVKWEKADKAPGSRKKGAEKLRAMLKSSLNTVMEEPGIFVFDTCRNWIDHIPVLPRSESNPDDVDTDAEDHDYDETRYRITWKRKQTTLTELRL